MFSTLLLYGIFTVVLSAEIPYQHEYSILTEIPDDIPDDVTEVLVKRTLLTRVPTGAFSHLTDCSSLELYMNQISTLEDRAFIGLVNLLRLDLSHNKLTTLSGMVFEGLGSLTLLDLSQNRLYRIEDGAFSHLTLLEELRLFNNELTQITSGMLDSLSILNKLDIKYNRIEDIEDGAFNNVPELESIYLDDNKLVQIRKEMFEGLVNPDLVLTLSYNYISYIEPGTFGQFTLAALSIASNNLTDFPRDIFDPDGYPTAQDTPMLLELIGNPMYCRPNLCWLQEAEANGSIEAWWDSDSLLQCFNSSQTALSDLTLMCTGSPADVPLDSYPEDNVILGALLLAEPETDYLVNPNGYPITRIRSGAFEAYPEKLHSITSINLERSNISVIENNAFKGLSQLVYLLLQSNSLTEITIGMFKWLPQLQKLFLFSNQISLIEDGAFESLGKLDELSLESNMLSEITPRTFGGLEKLPSLSLSSNSIANIEDRSFSILSSLTWLSLNNNNLVSIGRHAFEGLRSLTHLDLSDNPITSIECGSFSWFNLQVLELEYTNLREFPQNIFLPNGFPTSRSRLEVLLRWNLWNCDANMCWLDDASTSGVITWGNDFWCANHQNKAWSQVTINCTENLNETYSVCPYLSASAGEKVGPGSMLCLLLIILKTLY